MEDTGIGWIAAIIIGGIAGGLAEMVTRSNMGLIANLILGVIGAALGAWLFGLLGMRLSKRDGLTYLISGFVGACVVALIRQCIAAGEITPAAMDVVLPQARSRTR